MGTAFALAVVGLLSACTGAGEHHGHEAYGSDPSYAYAARVAVAPGEHQEAVSERHGGDVVVWRGDAGFAIMGFRSAPDGVGSDVVVESNLGSLSAPETAVAGGFKLWSGGYKLWSGGEADGGLADNAALWDHIGLPAARDQAPGAGAGVTVAVLDTGVDLTHPALRDALAPASSWYDFVARDHDPAEVWVDGAENDGYGHGTAVAGIVAQVAPAATLLPLRVLGPEGIGDLTDVVEAIDWAVDHGADVIVLSLGSIDDSAALRAVAEDASDRGVIVIASAGNTGDGRVTYPGAIDDDLVMSVGSVDPFDTKSVFSTYGSHLTLVAPGERVHTAAPGGQQAHWTGTSMSAPLVAGAIALALGELGLAGEEALEALLEVLVDTLVDVDEFEANRDYGDDLGGRLDVGAFLAAALDSDWGD